MTSPTFADLDRVVLPAAGLGDLFDALHAEGYPVLGPTVRDGVITIGPVTSPDDLPRGWGDVQDAGAYRLVRRDDDAYFGFAAPAGTWKRHLFPARSVLWRARVVRGAPVIEEDEDRPGRRALLGIRGCDLAAVGVQDRVLLHGTHPDPVYAARRADLLLVGVTCGTPASTCFCTSMGTGPSVGGGADIAMTELDPDDPALHRFLLEPRTAAGRRRGRPRGRARRDRPRLRRGGRRRTPGRVADHAVGRERRSPRGAARRCGAPALGRRRDPVPLVRQLHDGVPHVLLHRRPRRAERARGLRRAGARLGLVLRARPLLPARRLRASVAERALPAVGDPQVLHLVGPVRHVGLRRAAAGASRGARSAST